MSAQTLQMALTPAVAATSRAAMTQMWSSLAAVRLVQPGGMQDFAVHQVTGLAPRSRARTCTAAAAPTCLHCVDTVYAPWSQAICCMQLAVCTAAAHTRMPSDHCILSRL